MYTYKCLTDEQKICIYVTQHKHFFKTKTYQKTQEIFTNEIL